MIRWVVGTSQTQDLANRTVKRKIMSVRVREKTGCEGNSTRFDQVCWDPWVGREACLARVAARMKENRLTAHSMRGREGDHNRGRGGEDGESCFGLGCALRAHRPG